MTTVIHPLDLSMKFPHHSSLKNAAAVLNTVMDGFQQYFSTTHYSNDGDLIHLYLSNPQMKVAEIAQAAGCSLPEFYRILRRNNIEPCRLKTNQHLVVRYAETGYSIPHIAQLTGYTTRNVRYILAKNAKNDRLND
jgi:AraC-like DNA-binding protein